jgi:hypothetical protein
MKFTLCFVILSLWTGFLTIHAQTPIKPVLYNVTVDPESGYVIITWYPTPSIDIIEYYKVVESQAPIAGQPPVVTEISFPIDKDATSYIITTGDCHSRSVGYSVVAVNDIGIGPLGIFRSLYDDADSTIFLESDFDSCQSAISLSWNDYNTWRGSIAEYNIYRRVGQSIYEKLYTFEEGTNEFTIPNVEPNQAYDLFVEAVHNDGRKSTSNRITVITEMSEVPGFINADYATLGSGNTIDISFTMDAIPGNVRYNLLRSDNFDGTYNVIKTLETAGSGIQYTDQIPFTSGVYFYRLEALNNCGNAVTQSNAGNNIILNGILTDRVASMDWNEYRDWLGGVEQYELIRKTGRDNPIMDTINLTSGITAYDDNLNVLIDYENPNEGLVCYTVRARENTNIHGIQGISLSNQVCFSINPEVRIPNAFIPNDAEVVNQVFEPVFSFLPEHYEITIFNRLGTKVWEGSEPWDGKVNGKYVPEGVYLYYIRVFSFSAKITEYNGKVTVLYR